MAQFRNRVVRFLCIALLSSICGAPQIHAKKPASPKKNDAIAIAVPPSTPASGSLIQQKQLEALSQIDAIESIFDTIGQSLASGASNIPAKRKALTRKKLSNLRSEDIDKIKRFASVHVTQDQLYQLALFNQEVINVLEKAVKTNLRSIPPFDFAEIQKKYQATGKDVTVDKISSVLRNNGLRLVKLERDSQKIGLSGMNAFYRDIRKFNKDWHVGFWMEHAAVYSAFVVWYLYVTSGSKVEEFPLFGPLGKRIKKFKEDAIGSSPSSSEKTDKTPANLGYIEPITEIDPATGKTRSTGTSRYCVFGEYNDQLPCQAITLDGATFSNKAIDPRDSKKFVIVDGFRLGQVEGSSESTSQNSSNDHSFVTTMQNGIAAVIAIDNKAPIFTITTGKLFADYIVSDAKLAYEKIKIYKNRLDDYFFGTAKKHTHEEVGVRTERFKDIVGREEVKAELNRVIDYICNPDRFERAGIRVERGYLLAGEPQTGKTLMAKALAGEISAALERQGKNQKMRLFEISTENLAKKGIGYYMDLAKTFSPCILFLDELDLMRLQRDGDAKALSEFLTQMSGSLNNNEKDQVIILAATNKPENLDFALRQHGRFGKMFWFGKPTFKHRVEFFIKECEKRCMNPDNFNFISLAQQTEGCSFGSLDIVFKKALMHAKIENTPVTQMHFERAIDFEIRKLVPTGYSIPAEKEEVIAVRQAGKALANLLLAPAKTLCSVTVLPITLELEEEHVTQQYNFGEMKKKDQNTVRYGNIFAYHLYDALDIQTQDELVKQCKILLASSAAQHVYGLTSCAFDKLDKQEAFNLAKVIVLEGLDPKEMAKDIRNQKLTEAYRLLEKYEAEVETLLKKHKDDLSKIVKGLQQYKTLSISHINELLGKESAVIPAPTA